MSELKEKIRLTNNQEYDINNISLCFNIMTIVFDDDIDIISLLEDMSVFDTIYILTRGNSIYGKYTGFNTIYRKNIKDHVLMLSNDKSVYTEPIDTEITELPVATRPELTLDEIKKQKIDEITNVCNFNIIYGVYMGIDGETELFSYKPEDQSNLLSAVQLAITTQLNVPYHANEKSCRLFTPEEITNLYIKEMTNLMHHQTYTNQLKMYIRTIENNESVESIRYGHELTGTYLDTYNMIMEQSQIVVQKYIETLIPDSKQK